MFRSEVLEEAIHLELARLVPTDPMHIALRSRLRAKGRAPGSQRTPTGAIKRLDEQLERAKRLFEYGEYDWETFCARRDQITQQKRELADAATRPQAIDLEWCESQLLDLASAWQRADSSQRSRLVAGIFDRLEAEALPEGALRVVAVPREAWRSFFERLVLEHHTVACSNLAEVHRTLVEVATAVTRDVER